MYFILTLTINILYIIENKIKKNVLKNLEIKNKMLYICSIKVTN